MSNKDLVKKAKAYAKQLMTSELDVDKHAYHNIHHVEGVCQVSLDLAAQYSFSEDDLADLEIAAWLHDIGYVEGSQGHEERGVQRFKKLFHDDMDSDRLERIANLIRDTKMNSAPTTISGKIIKDADCHHVGTREYLALAGKLKSEIENLQQSKISEREWLTDNLKFLHQHKFYTPVAEAEFNPRKRKNILKVQKQLTGLVEYENQVIDVNVDSKDIALDLPAARADRGIETMFRVTLRNHNNLSVIADNKANIMLSINSIMLSIVLSSLASKLDTNSELTIPTILLTSTCVISIILAVFATRPKISTGDYSDEAFMNKKINLLFFGNFFKLPLDKFEWGINTLMNNEDMLYSSLTKDLYFLGVVLARKYRILWYCYNIFSVGIIITAISFIWVFATMAPETVDSVIPK